ncbi:hypothetical protein IW148_004238 [Coemansia sp. RSA 1199]|nr:hypothetical protein IW148_004238 [Coemansia sp. RSA 1199]
MAGGSDVATPESVGRQQFDELLDPSFDATHYAHELVRRRDTSLELKADKISSIMNDLCTTRDALDARLRAIVLGTHEQILEQVLGVASVDVTLEQVEDQVREIKQYMHALRTKIRVPYEQALEYTNQARNLQLATQHVRATSKFMQLVRRLGVQIPEGEGRPDYALAALTLVDIERLVASSDLCGIDVVDRALAMEVAPRRQQTMDEANEMLIGGMRRQHQSDVGSGLQILFNLGVISNAVDTRIQASITALHTLVAGRIDPRALHAGVREHNARATAIDGRDMVGIDSILWTRLEDMIDAVLSSGLEVRVLERVLQRKRDVLRVDARTDGMRVDASYLDVVAAQLGDRVLALWWALAVDTITAEIRSACDESSVVRQILTNSYPRLVQLFLPRLEPLLAARLGGVISVRNAESSVASVLAADGEIGYASDFDLAQSPNVQYSDWGMRVLWTRLLSVFEAEYVSKAASRMDDSVTRCFPAPPPAGLVDAQSTWSQRHNTKRDELTAVNTVPNRKLVASVVRSVGTELEMAKSDARLCAMVARAAARAIASFVAVTKDRLASVMSNPQVVDPCAASAHPLTRSVIGLINCVEALRVGVAELCQPNEQPLTASAQAVLCTCRDELQTFIDAQSDVLLSAADRAISSALLDVEDPSLWSRAEHALQWLQTQVLEPLDTRPSRRIHLMTDSYLTLFVHTVCATMPLTEATKLRLASELPQLEFACSQAASTVGVRVTGDAYKSVRQMRPLLFMSACDLAQVLGDKSAEWSSVSELDLLNHVVCRVATEGAGVVPHELLECSRREWLGCVAGSAFVESASVCRNSEMQHLWDTRDLSVSCRAVIHECLNRMLKLKLADDLSALRESACRSLITEAQSTFPEFNFVPTKLQTQKFVSHVGDKGDIISSSTDPLWIRTTLPTSRAVLVPTVYTQWQNPRMLPILWTWPVVIEKLVGGADLMTAGLVVPKSGLPVLTKGSLVAVCAHGEMAARAVGVMAVDTREIREVVGAKGKAVLVVHTYKDWLWEAGSKDEPPEIPVDSVEEAGVEESAAVEDTTAGVDTTDAIEGAIEELSVQDAAESESTAAVHVTPAEMDALLMTSLKQVMATVLDEKHTGEQLPIAASTLFSTYMLPNAPRNAELDIKKSSFKKLAKFLKAMEKHGLLGLKDIRGETHIKSLNWKHADLSTYTPYAKAKRVEKAEGAPAVKTQKGNMIGLEELLRVPPALRPLFDDVGGEPESGYMTRQQARSVLETYIKKHNLVDLRNPRNIRVDHLVCDGLLTKDEIAKLTFYPRDKLQQRLQDRMTLCTRLTIPGSPSVVRQGRPPFVDILCEKKMGNKVVTRAIGLEVYGVDPAMLAKELRVACASSTSVDPIPGKKTVSVLVQGHQVKIMTKLLHARGLPADLLKVTDKSGKSKK